MKNFETYLEVAREAAKKAGSLLLKNFGAKQELSKTEGVHYSIAEDKKCNDFYEEFLMQRTPEAALYTEEGIRSLNNDLVWTVDPIDGTSNYRVGLPLFVTQLCLLHRKKPVVSVLYNPALNEEYFAVTGKGAFLNGKTIHVSENDQSKRAMLLVAKGSRGDDCNVVAGRNLVKFGLHIRTVRMFGSTGIDLTSVAAGKAEISINSKSKLHDYAPGVLLVREAGGLVKNLEGGEWTIDDDSLVAANPRLMPRVLEILKQN